MNIKKVYDITDIHKASQKRLPRVFLDYIDSGSYQQQTVYENEQAFKKIRINQSAFKDCSKRNQSKQIFDFNSSVPFAIAPTGMAGMFWPKGEIALAQIAEKVSIPYVFSTMAICSLETVRKEVNNPFWFQLYLMKDRGFTKSLVERAKLAGCKTIFVNADLPVNGIRYSDMRNGLSIPPKFRFKDIINITTKQSWLWGYLLSKYKQFGNLSGHIPTGEKGMKSVIDFMDSQFDPSVTWKNVEWLRKIWDGNLVIKGILNTESAENAVKVGADGIVVSNHGGRQLDGVLPTIEALPAIAEKVKGNTKIILDSGIRSGQDVIKALALGADFTLVGRPFLYGLSAFGQKGVEKVYDILKKEIDNTMVLAGISDLNNISVDVVI
ncbi:MULTISPECIES: alpha-hydroxy acid oxidase [Francisella]|uniref:Alpha-hydroxy-acid oxidizing protein n=1 Tax=Francisella opportunistica TaxID=2016517 RepID=A0A345JRQ1_9GAMM|nr:MULTISPECIES: alpha-hydroxy acid oxidase [Francisella]APC91738.1 L-lactate dehydrogenase [Francisella sp. MA067296]AXH29997.1 alpha-hydroxy-acid oxidizing protein [Francisella opportunistica]AXH31641.1 alpha-hydroxy-acid oxidizing protein [Francisella opportunistica]AXH33287.1 alpha-hydroxy-acid oxidizing protein [Francisella opportunistica]